ncbi:BTB/POZ domain-containing protein 6 [Argiope bruennichi]|uniref:BTB/POZ domain-containing protein 6 n=1 Tax=Argiope bruennichi TaxID=94029 RepID=A0A8T0EUN0_ARGBR|nr:BTB/POZ domain-containing protein 6 [Argiope bruennichi]
MMESVNDKPQGLVARISTLLNNELCCDVVFHVLYNGQRSKFYGHSAILIAAGKEFPDLTKQTSHPKVIKISGFPPQIVKMMLTYLYTDELNILSMENAVDLYTLARMYCIDDLEKLCTNYITKEEVNIDNLFVKYESALSCDFPKLLENCRDLVQSETKAVFASRYFGEAPFEVVEDIFSLDHLNVSSELDVIQAAFRWSACECRRKGRPTEKLCIRDAIDPLLKHLRFLSLSADEFCDFAAKDDNIFTGYETALLTRKILQPDYKGEFPKYLCPVSKPRQPGIKTNDHKVDMNNFTDFYSVPVNKSTDQYSEPLLKSSLKSPYLEPDNKNTFAGLYSEPDKKIAVKSPNSEFVFRSNFNDHYFEQGFRSSPNDCFSEPSNKNNFNNHQFESASGNNSNDSSSEPVNHVKSVTEDALFFHQNVVKRLSAFPKPEQTPLFQNNQKKYTPMLKVFPQTQMGKQMQLGKQTFDFPLQEIKKGIKFASSQDIKCSANIRMRTGAIMIYGIELKIADPKLFNPDESFEVFSLISNNYMAKDEKFELKLKNSTLSLMYTEPLRVTTTNSTDIEITIEDLHLNRCFICHGQTYELNCGLNIKAEISVKSNRSNGQDNILYLISRIIYSSST